MSRNNKKGPLLPTAGQGDDGDGGNVIYTSDDTPEQPSRQPLDLSSQLDVAQQSYEEAYQAWRKLQDQADEAARAMFAAVDRLRELRRMLPPVRALRAELDSLNEELKTATGTEWADTYQRWLRDEAQYVALLGVERAEEASYGF